MRLEQLIVLFTIGSTLLVGCASAPQAENMAIWPGDLTRVQVGENLKDGVVVKEVLGGKETSSAGKPELGNRELKEALTRSFRRVHILSPNETGKYYVSAKVIHVDRVTSLVTTAIQYIVVESSSKKEIYNKVIRAMHHSTVGDALWGLKRLRLAIEGATKKNITMFVRELSELK